MAAMTCKGAHSSKKSCRGCSFQQKILQRVLIPTNMLHAAQQSSIGDMHCMAHTLLTPAAIPPPRLLLLVFILLLVLLLSPAHSMGSPRRHACCFNGMGFSFQSESTHLCIRMNVGNNQHERVHLCLKGGSKTAHARRASHLTNHLPTSLPAHLPAHVPLPFAPPDLLHPPLLTRAPAARSFG